MKCALIILLCIVALAVADYPLYIDELSDLVSPQDERELEFLEDDDFTPRSQLKSQADAILARQSPALQTAYQGIVARKESERQYKQQRKMQQYQARGVGNIYQQILDIEGNLSLSENQADQQKRQLERQLWRRSSADYPLYIDELADMVNKIDEQVLEMLEDDWYTPR
ncbi:hypothetical protein PFISCL1PPCAC_6565, partial [Pristionchus fissidentatus]